MQVVNEQTPIQDLSLSEILAVVESRIDNTNGLEMASNRMLLSLLASFTAELAIRGHSPHEQGRTF